eukprot:1666228-Prymnesium_polylepis.1
MGGLSTPVATCKGSHGGPSRAQRYPPPPPPLTYCRAPRVTTTSCGDGGLDGCKEKMVNVVNHFIITARLWRAGKIFRAKQSKWSNIGQIL